MRGVARFLVPGGANFMKRLILWTFLLLVGAGLGGGGTYVGLHWDRYNPLRDRSGHAEKTFLTKLRHTCANDNALKGVFIKSATIADGKLTVQGFAASQKQLAALHTASQAIIDENPDLQSQCNNGLATTDLKIIPLQSQLAVWQREFEECKGAEKDVGDNPLKLAIMRTTRLDDITFDEDGKLVLHGVCIRGNSKREVTGTSSTSCSKPASKLRD